MNSNDDSLMNEDVDVDGEEWGGMDEDSEEQGRVDKRQSAVKTNGAATSLNDNRPPTRAELRAIREAAALFGSGALKMQVCMLLRTLR